jgi:hypothetical protein
VLAFIPKWRITAVHLVLSRHAKHFARLANKGRAQLKGDSKMTHYVATVHLLFELDESMHDEMDIPDALNSILTENMRKYSRADSCLIDWTFGSNGHAADSIETVMLPDGYEPDETPFPHPVAGHAGGAESAFQRMCHDAQALGRRQQHKRGPGGD